MSLVAAPRLCETVGDRKLGEGVCSVQRLSHRYALEWAIRDISFEISERSVVGLLGSNGAGKSTLMNIMSGVLSATEGDVSVLGFSIKNEPLEAKRRIGFLPQQVPLYLECTVDEYLNHCAGLRGVSRKNVATAVDEAKAKVGVSHFSKRLIGALSGGYRQRVGIAGAILHNPSVVVLDEPTNGLDPNQILEIRKLIRAIASERTVLLSTHILSEVEAICDEIKMIERGQIVFEGDVNQYTSVLRSQSLIASFQTLPPSERVNAVDGVLDVETAGKNAIRMRLDAPAHEVSERLIRTAVRNGWQLVEIWVEKATLEEVFAALSEFNQIASDSIAHK